MRRLTIISTTVILLLLPTSLIKILVSAEPNNLAPTAQKFAEYKKDIPSAISGPAKCGAWIPDGLEAKKCEFAGSAMDLKQQACCAQLFVEIVADDFKAECADENNAKVGRYFLDS